MSVKPIAYQNDSFVQLSEMSISPFDRGYLFAHAAYEVTAVYHGELIDFSGHEQRLARTLDALSIPNPFQGDTLLQMHRTLITRNALEEGLIYLQVTAGDYDLRDFAGPDTIVPNVTAFAASKVLISDAARTGISAILTEDTRWQRRDLKTTQLLSQALAYRNAQNADATTAIMHENGLITEAASANVWIVREDGSLQTRERSSAILGGITRQRAIEELEQNGNSVTEQAFTIDELLSAQEVFTTSAGLLVAPVIEIDGHQIGSGQPGPITRWMQALYYLTMGADLTKIDWL